MPKNLVIDPNFIRAQGKIQFTDIPVNVYNKTIKEEKENFSKADFVRIFNDIAMLREFESMINEIKIKGEYQGFKHSYPGPAHLSIGQEAAAVGQAYILSTVCGDTPEMYGIEITATMKDKIYDTKGLTIKVTDGRLLEKTGGIVQGMSGSPIIQDGKLVGAVTHVLVNDPTRGYGIFIENMLDATG